MLGLHLGLGLGARPVVPGSGPDPEPSGPVTIFEADPALADTDPGNANTTFRVEVPITAAITGDVRVTIKPGASADLTLLGVGFGKMAGGYGNTAASILELPFSGNSGFVAAADEQVSDWTDASALGLGEGDTAVVTFTTGTSGHASLSYNASQPGGVVSNFQSGNFWASQNVDGQGFSDLDGYNFGVVKIETRSGAPDPEPNTIPMSFDDPMFTGMTELTSSLTLSDGQDLTKRSIIENVSSPASIVCEGNNEITHCRVLSRECVRLVGSTYLIDGCYLESEGTGDDHADTIQVYAGSEGGIFDITVRNSHIRAHTTAATAGFFIADNCVGDVTCENVIFQGGPFGVKFHADVGGDINVYFKDIFFVGPFGTDPFTFLNFGGGEVVIQQWDNVRHATIVDGILVPGELIPSP